MILVHSTIEKYPVGMPQYIVQEALFLWIDGHKFNPRVRQCVESHIWFSSILSDN